MGRMKIRRGRGTGKIAAKDLILGAELEYIRRRAAQRDPRFVQVGHIALFSTESGDAWLIDPADRLAARVAHDGYPVEVAFTETESQFAIGWKGTFRIESGAFVYTDDETGREFTLLGPFVQKLAALG